MRNTILKVLGKVALAFVIMIGLSLLLLGFTIGGSDHKEISDSLGEFWGLYAGVILISLFFGSATSKYQADDNDYDRMPYLIGYTGAIIAALTFSFLAAANQDLTFDLTFQKLKPLIITSVSTIVSFIIGRYFGTF